MRLRSKQAVSCRERYECAKYSCRPCGQHFFHAKHFWKSAPPKLIKLALLSFLRCVLFSCACDASMPSVSSAAFTNSRFTTLGDILRLRKEALGVDPALLSMPWGWWGTSRPKDPLLFSSTWTFVFGSRTTSDETRFRKIFGVWEPAVPTCWKYWKVVYYASCRYCAVV